MFMKYYLTCSECAADFHYSPKNSICPNCKNKYVGFELEGLNSAEPEIDVYTTSHMECGPCVYYEPEGRCSLFDKKRKSSNSCLNAHERFLPKLMIERDLKKINDMIKRGKDIYDLHKYKTRPEFSTEFQMIKSKKLLNEAKRRTLDTCWFCKKNRGTENSTLLVELVTSTGGKYKKFTNHFTYTNVPRCERCAEVHEKANNKPYVKIGNAVIAIFRWFYILLLVWAVIKMITGGSHPLGQFADWTHLTDLFNWLFKEDFSFFSIVGVFFGFFLWVLLPTVLLPDCMDKLFKRFAYLKHPNVKPDWDVDYKYPAVMASKRAWGEKIGRSPAMAIPLTNSSKKKLKESLIINNRIPEGGARA